MEHWLNGRKILEFEAWTDDWFARKNSGKWETAPEYGLAHRGVICLQDHGYPASFRNLKVKELPRKAGRETELFNGEEREIPSSVIGEKVMHYLKDLDQVAYVRFASIYREFKDVNTFMDELKKMLDK